MKLSKGDGMNSAYYCRTEYVIIVDVDIFKEFILWFFLRDWFLFWVHTWEAWSNVGNEPVRCMCNNSYKQCVCIIKDSRVCEEK